MYCLALIFRIICLYFYCVGAHDLPLAPNQMLRFKTGDAIYNMTLRLHDLPNSAADAWSATFYCSSSENSRTKIWGPLVLKANQSKDNPYSSPLHKSLNDATLHLEMTMGGAVFYDLKIATLIYDENRPEPPHICLQPNACVININRWERKVVMVQPTVDEVYFSPRVQVAAVCKSSHSARVVWFNSATRREVTLSKGNLVLDKSFDGATLQCAEQFLDKDRVIRTVKSERTITLKYISRLTSKPPINNVTYYNIGDIFKHTCYGMYMFKTPTVRWVRSRGNAILSSSNSEASVRLELDATYDNEYMTCVMSVLVNYSPQEFEDVESISTRLMLIAADGGVPVAFGSVWFPVALGVAAVALAAAAAASAYRCWRRRSECEIQVENELYGADYGVVYAQLYEQRQGAPPPRARREYARIIGHLRGNN